MERGRMKSVRADGTIDEQNLEEQCQRRIRKISFDSSVISEGETILDRESSSKRILAQDVEEGLRIGRGAYNDVVAVRRLSNSGSNCSSVSATSINSEDFTSPVSRSYYYAMKKLRSDIQETKKMNSAVVDLAVEAQYLQSLSHPHVVNLEGLGDKPGSKEFFLILERLECTMSAQIVAWKNKVRLFDHGYIYPKNSTKEEYLNILLNQRLSFANDISSALSYLHGKNLMFRDLKPDNIGFSHDNIIKLFDFGFARELKQSERLKTDMYLISFAGSRRYMSPEVLSCKPHGLPADVFGFTLVAWEMIHLEKPFKSLNVCNVQRHQRQMLLWKKRPKIAGNVPKPIADSLRSGWSHNPADRPRMCEMNSFLTKYVRENGQ